MGQTVSHSDMVTQAITALGRTGRAVLLSNMEHAVSVAAFQGDQPMADAYAAIAALVRCVNGHEKRVLNQLELDEHPGTWLSDVDDNP